MSTRRDWFVERREAVRLARQGSAEELEITRYQGIGETEREGATTMYRWRHLPGQEAGAPRLPAPIRAAVNTLVGPWSPKPAALAVLSRVAAAIHQRAARSGWERFALSLRHYRQQRVASRAGPARRRGRGADPRRPARGAA